MNLGSSYAGGQWAEGDEPLYYIVSPKDAVIAKPRSVSSHFVLVASLWVNDICKFTVCSVYHKCISTNLAFMT